MHPKRDAPQVGRLSTRRQQLSGSHDSLSRLHGQRAASGGWARTDCQCTHSIPAMFTPAHITFTRYVINNVAIETIKHGGSFYSKTAPSGKECANLKKRLTEAS